MAPGVHGSYTGAMNVLRTPDDRFASLPGYAFAPHYVEVGDLRIHYLDEGDPAAPPVLLMHGEPSWSYLYRHMIPGLVDAGHRVIAPDLVGFGRSDKPDAIGDYTYQRHVDWMRGALDALALRNITLFGQDWGSLIGLRLAAEQPDRFDRIVIGNGFLPTGDGPVPLVFRAWRTFARWTPVFDCGRIVNLGCATKLSPQIIAAYNAPFPDNRYKAGARAFPRLVPTTPDDPAAAANRKAWAKLGNFEKPFLTTFSDGDPIMRGGDRILQRHVAGANGQPHTTIRRAGHFLQEDKGEELADVVNRFIAATPAASA